MPAVNEHDELNRFRPPVVDQRIERGARRPARVQDVIDEQDLAVVDRELDIRLANEWLRTDGVTHRVVAIQRDVERAGRYFLAGDFAKRARDTPRDRHAAS